MDINVNCEEMVICCIIWKASDTNVIFMLTIPVEELKCLILFLLYVATTFFTSYIIY
jgi:hypothetical protein